MPDHTIAEKEKNRRNRSAQVIAALDASEGGSVTATVTTTKPAKKKKKKRAERIGVGDNAATRRQQTARVVTGLREKFERAMTGGNVAKANDLRERIKAVIAAGQ